MKDDYFLGLDLGTSRTSIATNTGVTLTEESCVGFAKDHISLKRLKGRQFLIGTEAIENRLAVDLVYPLADGVLDTSNKRTMEAAEILIRFIISKAFEDDKKKIYAAVGVPARASIESKKDIINLFKGLVEKLLIVSEPFAVSYGMDKFDECLMVDIGSGSIDFCIIAGHMPTENDQLTLTTAGNYFDKLIMDSILKKYPKVQLTPQIVKKIKEKHGYITGHDKIEIELTVDGKINTFDIGGILKDCCLQFTKPIAQAVKKLVGSFDPEFQGKLRNNIIIAGGGSRLKGIDLAIEESLIEYGGGKVECVQDSEYAGAKGSLLMSLEMPSNSWEKIE